MKKRACYVSNSSSSSFLVYVKAFDSIKGVYESIDKGNGVYFVDCKDGFSLNCADFIFKLTKTRYDFLCFYRDVLDKDFDKILKEKSVSLICPNFDLKEKCAIDMLENSDSMFMRLMQGNRKKKEYSPDENFEKWVVFKSICDDKT